MHQQQLCPQRRFKWDRLTDICTQCSGAAPKAALTLLFLPFSRSAQSTVEFNFQTFIHSCFIHIYCSYWIGIDASSFSLLFSPLPHCFLQPILWIMNLNFAGEFHNTHRHGFMVSDWPIFRCMLLISHYILCKRFCVELTCIEDTSLCSWDFWLVL